MAGLRNLGFNDIGFSIKKGEKYDFPMFARGVKAEKPIKVIVAIQNPASGEIYGETSLEISGEEWENAKG